MKKLLLKTLTGVATVGTVLAPAITLASCKSKPKGSSFDISITGGATYDKTKSKLTLNKDSTIVLVPDEGKTINGVQSVKVGDNELTVDKDYTFSKSEMTIKIVASAMASKTIKIVVDDSDVHIEWTDGWYAYEKKESGGALYSNFVDVEFKLKNKLESNEKLYFYVETTEATDPVELKYETLTCIGNKVTIPFRLKTPYSFIEFGSYAYYDITFVCVNDDEEIVWADKIEDCYLFLLFALKSPQVAYEAYTTEPGKADVETRTTVNVPHKKFDDNELTLKAEIVDTTKKPSGSNANVVTVSGQKHPYKSDATLYQVVEIDDKTGLVSGDTFEFTIKFTVTLALFPERPIDFVFEGVKLTYR